jgi:dihydroxyacetone kinase
VKKLINHPQAVVTECLEGIVRLDSQLALLDGSMTVVRADARELAARGHVAIVSGGGAGHEPAHAGFVGEGLLTAAVSGEVFTSPSVDAVLAAIRAVAGPAGVLLVVKNYTGDRLNFGLAAELAKAAGVAVRMVVVGDDVALAQTAGAPQRRGLAGTLLVHKVAGAAAAAGASLDQVADEAEAAAASLATMGVALSACTPPAAGRPGFILNDNEVELGLGIHGEPGVQRVPLQAADQLVDTLLGRVVDGLELGTGARVALLVNGLGGTPAMELSIVMRRALAWLSDRDIVVERALCGSYMTALEMAGCSLTLMRLDDDRLRRLEAPARALAWPNAMLRPAASVERLADKPPAHAPVAETTRMNGVEHARLGRAILAVTKTLQEAEVRLTDLDRQVGDGDLGTSLARGARAVESALDSYDLSDASATMRDLAATLRQSMGGTSGPLYAIGLLRLATRLRRRDASSASLWAEAFEEACVGMCELGGADEGDRTMMDALIPASQALRTSLAAGAAPADAMASAAAAARRGAQATAGMIPKKGRSSYLGSRAVGVVDPGAEAVSLWLSAIESAVIEERPSTRSRDHHVSERIVDDQG